jgi:hypothetical protein
MADPAERAEVSTPPFEPLLEVVARLERAGIACALGGSGLLVALGLGRVARDWDLTTDAALDRLTPVVAGSSWTTTGSGGVHADAKLMLPEVSIEIISGFAFHGPRGVIRVPTIVTRHWRGVPVGSPEAWLAAYHLLGRPAKRDLLLAHLSANGSDAGALARLLEEPLPGELAGMLRGLARIGSDPRSPGP